MGEMSNIPILLVRQTEDNADFKRVKRNSDQLVLLLRRRRACDLREPWPPYQGGGDIMHSLREARVKNDYSILI